MIQQIKDVSEILTHGISAPSTCIVGVQWERSFTISDLGLGPERPPSRVGGLVV